MTGVTNTFPPGHTSVTVSETGHTSVTVSETGHTSASFSETGHNNATVSETAVCGGFRGFWTHWGRFLLWRDKMGTSRELPRKWGRS